MNLVILLLNNWFLVILNWNILIKKQLILDAFCFYSVPLLACSLSIDSNSALKFPAPKPLAPIL